MQRRQVDGRLGLQLRALPSSTRARTPVSAADTTVRACTLRRTARLANLYTTASTFGHRLCTASSASRRRTARCATSSIAVARRRPCVSRTAKGEYTRRLLLHDVDGCSDHRVTMTSPRFPTASPRRARRQYAMRRKGVRCLDRQRAQRRRHRRRQHGRNYEVIVDRVHRAARRGCLPTAHSTAAPPSLRPQRRLPSDQRATRTSRRPPPPPLPPRRARRRRQAAAAAAAAARAVAAAAESGRLPKPPPPRASLAAGEEASPPPPPPPPPPVPAPPPPAPQPSPPPAPGTHSKLSGSQGRQGGGTLWTIEDSR